MTKKGISPLIATVLLIGFTIVIATGVILWWSGSVKDIIDKQGAEQAAQMRCATGTFVSVISCDVDEDEIIVKNDGTEIITVVIVRSTTNDNELVTEEVDIESGEEENVDISDLQINKGDTIEVIPAILETESSVLVSCTNQLIQSMC